MKLGSDFQIMCKETYKELFDQELKIEPAHGCVEAGFASHALPGMDIVGIAPYSRGAHTYYEHLYLDSMKPFWEFLITLLEKSCKIKYCRGRESIDLLKGCLYDFWSIKRY